MKFNKLSFMFLTIVFVALFSFNVSAGATTRSLPTIYKLTGDLNLSNAGNNYFYILAAVDNYAVGKSSCNNYEGTVTQLTNGIFIGPIPSDIVGHSSRSFDLKLVLKNFGSQAACVSSNNGVIINVGELAPTTGVIN